MEVWPPILVMEAMWHHLHLPGDALAPHGVGIPSHVLVCTIMCGYFKKSKFSVTL